MEAHGNRVSFSPAESAEFQVEPNVSIESALETAESFLAAGTVIAREKGVTLAVDDEFFLPRLAQLSPRAAALIRFSSAIKLECELNGTPQKPKRA